MYNLLGFGLVALIGYIVIYCKKNRRRWRCKRVKRYLLRHPSNGVPSEFFINALERKLKDIRIYEFSDKIRLMKYSQYSFNIWCQNGVLHTSLVYPFGNMKYRNTQPFLRTPEREIIATREVDKEIRMLYQMDGEPEWKVVTQLMNCGIYCMK